MADLLTLEQPPPQWARPASQAMAFDLSPLPAGEEAASSQAASQRTKADRHNLALYMQLPWMVPRDHADGWRYYHCLLCDKRADIGHLL